MSLSLLHCTSVAGAGAAGRSSGLFHFHLLPWIKISGWPVFSCKYDKNFNLFLFHCAGVELPAKKFSDIKKRHAIFPYSIHIKDIKEKQKLIRNAHRWDTSDFDLLSADSTAYKCIAVIASVQS